jgi:hypothetical protein
MQSILDLQFLAEKIAAALPDLNLDGDEQEEYSTMPLWLQKQIEGRTPNQTFVDQCLDWLDDATAKSRLPLHQSPAA